MFVLVTSVCLAFSDADTEFDFALMTSAYTVNTLAKQHLALAGS